MSPSIVVTMASLLPRLVLDLVCAGIVIGAIYRRLYGRRDYVFTYWLFNLITLCLCFVLGHGPTSLGVALALFGVFGILRYRTEQIEIRDLTYLFVVIGVGVLNALADVTTGLAELIAADALIVVVIAWLERVPRGGREQSLTVDYDRLDLLAPERGAELADDLKARVGLAVLRVEVRHVDLVRDAAEIVVVHRENRQLKI